MAIYINKDGTAKRMDGAGDGSLYAPVTSIATPENGDTASKAYAVGEMFIRGGKLCTCIVAISAGDTLVKDTNYKEGSVGEVLTELNSNIQSKIRMLSVGATTSATIDHIPLASVIVIARGSVNIKGLYMVDNAASVVAIVPSDGVAITFTNWTESGGGTLTFTNDKTSGFYATIICVKTSSNHKFAK